MRLLWWFLSSPFLWALRIVTWMPATLMWSDTMDVESMIHATDAEFAPVLILMGVVIPFIISWGRCIWEKSEANKTKDTGNYEPLVLGGNVATAIVGVLATLCIPGMYYGAVGAEQVADGMYLIGLAVAILFGWFGDKLIFWFLEAKRNAAKAQENRAEATKTE